MTEQKTNQRLTCRQRFGRWTVLGGCVTTSRGERKYLCRCDCGTERYVLERSLLYGGSQSCGCLRKEMRIRPMLTICWGRLLVTFVSLERAGSARKWGHIGLACVAAVIPARQRLLSLCPAVKQAAVHEHEELCCVRYHRQEVRPVDCAILHEKA